jgi:hypothetical protein
MLYLGLAPFLQSAPDSLFSASKPGVKVEEWAPRMFNSCRGSNSLTISGCDRKVLIAGTLSIDALMYWVLWESARYFVNGKLRTPMGAPAESLESLEKTLESFLVNLSSSYSKNRNANLRNVSTLERLNYLLIFLDLLELQIINGGTGTFQPFPLPPKSSIIFLYANMKVCNDWFSRINSLRIEAARLVENDGMELRLSFQTLSNSTPISDEKSFISLYNTLMKIQDYDMLEGLSRYSQTKLSWHNSSQLFLSISSRMAHGEFQLASDFFLKNSKDTTNPFLDEMQYNMVKCYTALQDWKQAKNVLDKIDHRSKIGDCIILSSFWSNSSFEVKSILNPIQRLKIDVAIEHGLTNTLKMIFLEQNIANLYNRVHVKQLCELTEPISLLLIHNNDVRYMEHCILAQGISFKNEFLGSEADFSDFSTSLLPLWVALDSLHSKTKPLDSVRSKLFNVSVNTGNLSLASMLLPQRLPTLEDGTIQIELDRAKLTQTFDVTRATVMILDVLKSSIQIDCQLIAKACNLIVTWNTPLVIDPADKYIRDSLSSVIGASINCNEFHTYQDWLTTCLLGKSLNTAPQLSETWYLWGNYCFGFASDIMADFKQHKSRSLSFQDCFLSLEKLVLPISIYNDVIDYFLRFFYDSEGEITAHPSWYTDDSVSSEQIIAIDLIFKSIRTKVVAHFRSAVMAYFRYLEVSHNISAINSDDGIVGNVNSISVTLRLIRILVRFGDYLHDSFESGFESTPLGPWKNVIPQLIPRLFHSSKFIREQICRILCRIGSDYPHLLMYPAITSTLKKEKSNLFSKVLDSLDKNIVIEMSKWISELQRITVLWPEMWIHGLGNNKILILRASSG